MSKFNAIQLDAGHDTNGNPQRIFVILDAEGIVATYDEGYAGSHAITNRHHKAAARNAPTFATTKAEYNCLKGSQ